MPSVAENKIYYADYDWSRSGSEWSHYWGSSDAMWETCIYPRIGQFLPTGTIVEIGAGHGRVSKLLQVYAKNKLILTDIMEPCVDACNKLFMGEPKVTCKLSNGYSLDGIEDNSVNFIFSFYSLVDADIAAIRSYVEEFSRVLTNEGVVFLHHSNAGAYYDECGFRESKSMQLLSRYRDITMSAKSMQNIAQDNGLLTISQECINWDIKEVLSDCFTVMVKPDSMWANKPVLYNNRNFRREMDSARSRFNGLRNN